MKTLKITLLLALFLTVSSQTREISSENTTRQEVRNYDKTKPYYDLLAHSKDKLRIPTQG